MSYYQLTGLGTGCSNERVYVPVSTRLVFPAGAGAAGVSTMMAMLDSPASTAGTQQFQVGFESASPSSWAVQPSIYLQQHILSESV